MQPNRLSLGRLCLLSAALVATAALLVWLSMDARGGLLARNSLYLAVGTCAISLPVGTALAMLLVRTDVPGRRAAVVVLGAMLFMPLYLQSSAWQAGFGQQGWYSLACSTPGTGPPLDGWRGAIWIHGLASIPWVTLIVGVGLRLVEPELEEQALLDGTAGQVFCRVTLPRALPSIGAAGLWVAVTTAGEMTVTDMWMLRTYAEELYTGFALGEGPREALVRVLPGMMIVAWLVVAALVVCDRLAPPQSHAPAREPWTFRLGRWRGPAVVSVAAVILLLAAVPLGNLCYKAGVRVEQAGRERVRTWTAGKLLESIEASTVGYGTSPGCLEEFGWSLAIGALSAIGAVAAAVPLAWRARRGGRRAVPAMLTAAVCLALPGPMIGLGLIALLYHPGWPVLGPFLGWLCDRTLAAPVAATMIRSLPAVIFIMWYALRTIPDETIDAAAVDGAGPVTRLCRIALPQRTAALAAAWLVALAVSMGDLSASILVLPPGVDPLSRRIFGLIHYGVEDRLAGISLFVCALFAVLAAAAMWCAGRSRRHSQRG